MKKITKLLAMLFAVIFVVGMISACQGGGGSATTAAGGDAADATEAAAPADDGADATEAAAPANDGQVYSLKVQSQDPETSATGQFLESWAQAVEDASGGQLDITVYHGGSLGSAAESYNMVVGGSVDIAWGLPSMSTGKFPLTDVCALPFTGVDTLQSSYAIWDLYESTDYLKDEWSEVKVILLHTNCDTPLIIKGNKIESLDDFQGRQTRFIGGASTSFANYVGIVPITMAPADIYEGLEKGTIDSAANCGWDLTNSLKLYEQADWLLDWHFNVNPYFFVMNWDSYNNLPADLQAVIDEYSGYKALEYVGTKWQDVKKECMDKNADKVYELSDADMETLFGYADDAIAVWAEGIEGVDGIELYDAYMERVEKYQDKIAD